MVTCTWLLRLIPAGTGTAAVLEGDANETALRRYAVSSGFVGDVATATRGLACLCLTAVDDVDVVDVEDAVVDVVDGDGTGRV